MARVTQQILDLVQRATGVQEVAAERMPQLVRRHSAGQSRPARAAAVTVR